MKKKLISYILVCGFVFGFGFVGSTTGTSHGTGDTVKTLELPTIY